MPDADVKIKVEIANVIRTTCSFSSTVNSNLIGDISIVGSSSNEKLDLNTTTSSNFEQGEKVNITISLGTNHSKKLKAKITNTDEEIELTLNTRNKKYTGSFTLLEGGVSILIEEGEENTVRTLTVPSTSTIEYYLTNNESSKVESLGNLYDLDEFYFVVKDEVKEGYTLKVTIKIGGKEQNRVSTTKIGNQTAYKVSVSGDVEIIINQIESN